MAARVFAAIKERFAVHLAGVVALTIAIAPASGCSADPGVLTVTPPPRDSVASAATPPLGPMKAMYQMDARHSGRSPFLGPRQAVLLRGYDTANPALDTPEPGAGQPDVQGSTAIGREGELYVGNVARNLFALHDRGSGSSLELLWRFHPPAARTTATSTQSRRPVR